jgi:hypothetical protein
MDPAGTVRMRFLPCVFPYGREGSGPHREGYRPARTTGLRKVQMPVISISTVSLCLMLFSRALWWCEGGDRE